MPETPSKPPVIALTIGDPTGIGPEIAAKFLRHQALQPDLGIQIRVFGDIANLVQTAESLNIELPDNHRFDYEDMQKGRLSSHSKAPGQTAFDSIEAAVSQIHAGEAQALVTGPISKENLLVANVPYTGHTEMLQQLARKAYGQPYQSDMLFVYRQFRMLLLTRHVSLRKVSETLDIRGVSQSLGNLAEFFQKTCQIQSPRLCILGVNPHAGEIDGDEEERILKPALKLTSAKYGFGIEAPVPADAAFRHFDINHLRYDAYVAAYHDQGLIPFKMVAGLNAVNVTIGLPFLRTSVSHGTAPDIVGQGIADPCSLIEAYNTALQFTLPHRSLLAEPLLAY